MNEEIKELYESLTEEEKALVLEAIINMIKNK